MENWLFGIAPNLFMKGFNAGQVNKSLPATILYRFGNKVNMDKTTSMVLQWLAIARTGDFIPLIPFLSAL